MKTFDEIREQMKPPGFFEPASKHREYNRQQVYKSWQKQGAAAAAAKGKKPTTIGQKVKDKLKSVFKKKDVSEGYASYAQQKAAHASMAERGKKKKKEDTSDAVKAFLAKGGKIKKLPPAKAQGYHGKDDPGKGVAGMIDKPDTKAMGTRKKIGSMK